MTDRDEFAKAALIGFTSSLEGGTYDLDLAAKQAYEIADAMLRQREKCQISSQENLTLTDAQREAISFAIDCMRGMEDASASWAEREDAATGILRGLLGQPK
jgi:hypothetical protein